MKIIKGLFLFLLLMVSALFTAAVSTSDVTNVLPVIGQSNWGNPILLGFNQTLDLFRVVHTENGTLKKGLNVSVNELNVTNNLIVLGSIFAEIPDSFKNSNWTSLYNNEANTRFSIANFTNAYDNRNDRFSIANFTENYEVKSYWKLANFTSSFQDRLGELWNYANFTSAYDNRNDRFGNINFTAQYDNRIERYSVVNFTANFADRLAELWKLNNFTSAFENRLAELWNIGNFTKAYADEYALSGYKKGNITIDFPNLDTDKTDDQTEASAWKLANDTSSFNLLYDGRADRFTIENGTGLPFSNFRIENGTALPFSNYQEINFTNQYESQAYWKTENQTAREGTYFQYLNFSSQQSTNTTHVACWKTATTLGFCADQPDVIGVCTCV